MPFLQPAVTPLPTGIDLKGQVAIVTGGNAGIGFESVRQLLVLGASTVVIAARSSSKAEEARKKLLADTAVQKHNPSGEIKIMKLDLDSYESVLEFSEAVRKEFRELHILLANAGIGILNYHASASGHERNTQVNYLSNVLLTLELLPLLEATAEKTGSPSRLSWVGSRYHMKSTLAIPNKTPLKPGVGILEYLDDRSKFSGFTRYPDTKLLCALFLQDIAKKVSKEKVIINTMCPGMVDTDMSDVLPIYFRIPMNLVKKLRARSPEEAGWIVAHAVVVAGPESHGGFLGDKTLLP
jgi:NAD(P)-dependent dehydrogenase (short-subunit alcohol dehydrogenase family)